MINEYLGDGIGNEFQLLFFYAGYSTSCNHHLELLDFIEKRFPKVKILKINTTKYPILKKQFMIHTIPAYFILDNGKILAKTSGTQNKIGLTSWIEQFYQLKYK